MSNLTILNKSIRSLDNLYSLNDLHIAGGAEKRHQPALFLRLDQTQELISEIERSTDSCFGQNSDLQICRSVKTVRGGRNPALQGTWACEELALAYATWISPKFHLVVLRAFIAMHRGETSQKSTAVAPKPEPMYTFQFREETIRNLLWTIFAHIQMNGFIGELEEPLRALGSSLAPRAYSQHREYQRNHKQALATAQTLLKPFLDSTDSDWQRLIRNLSQQPKQKRLALR